MTSNVDTVNSGESMSEDISNNAYKIAAITYLIIGFFTFYVFKELGVFLATHYFPASTNTFAFSINNPSFPSLNRVIAGVLTLIILYILFVYRKLRDYIVDVSDELTRVSWAGMDETKKATSVVIALCFVSAIFLFVADVFFLKIVNALMATAFN